MMVKKGAAYLKLSRLAFGTTYSWNVKAVGNGKDIKDSERAVSGNDWKFVSGVMNVNYYSPPPLPLSGMLPSNK